MFQRVVFYFDPFLFILWWFCTYIGFSTAHWVIVLNAFRICLCFKFISIDWSFPILRFNTRFNYILFKAIFLFPSVKSIASTHRCTYCSTSFRGNSLYSLIYFIVIYLALKYIIWFDFNLGRWLKKWIQVLYYYPIFKRSYIWAFFGPNSKFTHEQRPMLLIKRP